jgi:hypothetical protein
MRIHNLMWGRTETPPATPTTEKTTGDAPAQPLSNPVQTGEGSNAEQQRSDS